MRERIADWISGGALSRAIADAEYERDLQKKYYRIACASNRKEEAAKDLAFMLEVALRDICNMQTPSANATVRRMAAAAKDALK